MDATSNTVGSIEAGGNANLHVENRIDVYHTNNTCLADLRPTDPRDDKKRIESKDKLLKDSYGWILDNADYQQWHNDEQSRLLWIKGDPGKGKTMLLCGIIDELNKETGWLLSYFFCQATDSRINSATAVLRGLIYLLVDKQPSLLSHVQEKYNHAGKGLFEDVNAWVALSEILTSILQDPNLQSAFLIIDALDECVTDLPQLLDLIAIKSSEFPRVKWIVSSRNWPNIEEQLEVAGRKVRLCLELNEKSISAAVSAYIRHKVARLAEQKKYDDKTRRTVECHLSSNANDTFLWVALVCQALAKVPKRHALIKLESFPPGLDSLYGRMIKHISNSDDAYLCEEILAVASVVYRPVTLEELKVLVESLQDLDPDDFEEIIKSCGSFLTLREGVIYFVHQSAKDFLLEKASNGILPSGIAHQHQTIFSRSLGALSKTLRRDIYNLSTPGFTIDQISLPDPDPLASIRYSCVYWVDHLGDSDSEPEAKMSNKDLQDGGVVHDFFKKKYLYWLESLSLLRSISEGALAVQKLEALVRNMEARELPELLRDARRFILSHKRAIEIAPLQVYASALLFSPTGSQVRELFMEEQPDWIVLKPHMELDWNACLLTLEDHSGSVESVAFSADGQRLASGSHDRTIKVWDAASGACLQTLEGHSGWVNSVAFSADSQRLASGSHDRTIKVWDAATGACLQTLEVGIIPSHRSFDLKTNTRLFTNIGLLSLDLSPGINNQLTEASHRVCHSGYGISTDGLWIVKDEDKMLWLPTEYRASASAVAGSTVAIGCHSGGVLVMKFS
ncbi:Fc.00g082230.m01.CDS01 [Cosmosporella sp. VM-42]